MIEDIKDLKLDEKDTEEQVSEKIKELLGISLDTMKESIFAYIKDKAEEMVLEMVNIAPNGNYEELIENNDDMASFLKTEACKLEHWKLHSLETSQVNPALIEFIFGCNAVDDGDAVKGFVFISKSGIIRHAFAQGSP